MIKNNKKSNSDRREISLRNLTDDEVVERAMIDLSSGLANKSRDFERNTAYRKMYLNLDPPETVIDSSTGKIDADQRMYSNTSLPIAAAMVDSASANLYNILFPNDDYLKFKTRHWEDEFYYNKILGHMKDRHVQMKFQYRIFEILQQMLCYDYCISFMRWQIEPGFVYKRSPQISVVDSGGIKYENKTFENPYEFQIDAIDRPDLQIIDFFNCVHDKGAKRGFEDSTYFIDWRDVPLEELKNFELIDEDSLGKYKNISKALKETPDDSIEGHQNPDPRDKGKDFINNNRGRILRYWSRDHIAEIMNSVVISRTDIDGWPLQQWKTFLVPNEFRGMGLLERIERPALDVNAIINTRRNTQNLLADPIAAIDEDLLEEEDGGVGIMFPGKVFVNRSGGATKDKIFIHNPGGVSQSIGEELSIQLESMKISTGMGGNAMGEYSSGRRSAREASFVNAGKAIREMKVAVNTEINCLIPIYYWQFKLETKNLTKTEMFQAYGKDGLFWEEITSKDYRFIDIPEFIPMGSSFTSNYDLKINNMFTYLKMAMSAPQYHNLENIFAEIGMMLNPKDYDKFTKDPRQERINIPPMMENKLLALGNPVNISEFNNHQEHLAVHSQLMNTPDFQIWPELYKINLQSHIRAHEQGIAQTQAPQQPRQEQSANPQGQDDSDLFRGIRNAG